MSEMKKAKWVIDKKGNLTVWYYRTRFRNRDLNMAHVIQYKRGARWHCSDILFPRGTPAKSLRDAKKRVEKWFTDFIKQHQP